MADTITFSPRTIHDANDNLEGVILEYREYSALLRLIAESVDWEELPDYLQDGIDNLLADEAEPEGTEPIPLSTLLADLDSVD